MIAAVVFVENPISSAAVVFMGEIFAGRGKPLEAWGKLVAQLGKLERRNNNHHQDICRVEQSDTLAMVGLGTSLFAPEERK